MRIIIDSITVIFPRVVPGPMVAATPGNLLELQIFGPAPNLLELEIQGVRPSCLLFFVVSFSKSSCNSDTQSSLRTVILEQNNLTANLQWNAI